MVNSNLGESHATMILDGASAVTRLRFLRLRFSIQRRLFDRDLSDNRELRNS